LWDNTLGRFAYMEPLCLQKDLERLWPGPVVPHSVKARQQLLEALLKATSDGAPLKKEAALEAVKSLPFFGVRRFNDAWRLVPVDRKIGRGKRGPNRHV
jgi:hypothetical protein